MKVDKIHYSLNKLLSYNKPFNFVVSAREAGKSTAIWLYCYKQFKKGRTVLVLRRLIADITSTYIEDVENILNKFLDEPVQLIYKKGDIKEGVVSVYIREGDEEKPFFRVVALSNPLSRIKSLMFPNLSTIIFDEFICNTRLGEKYLQNEVFKFKEVFNTFQREADKLRVIFAGNPYSLYNPYFSWIEVDTKKLYPGSFIVGETYCAEIYELTQELKEYILEKNPLYKFDDSYMKYAFDGRAINDSYINIIDKQPDGYALKCVFYIQGKYLGVYRITNEALKAFEEDWRNFKWYWMAILPDYKSVRRQVACIDYNELIEGNFLLSNEDKKAFYFLKDCFRNRKIAFKSIEESYLFEEIFNYI